MKGTAMEIEPTYRTDPTCEDGIEGRDGWSAIVRAMKKGGVLVLDTRLQDIADAWSAHSHAMGEGQYRETYAKLADVLDALTDEDET